MNKIFKIVLLLCFSFLSVYKTSNASNEKIALSLLENIIGYSSLSKLVDGDSAVEANLHEPVEEFNNAMNIWPLWALHPENDPPV